jgi:hypothetical protein
MAAVIGHVSPELALDHVRDALPLIDRKLEPRLELCARHNFAWFLASAGKAEEALTVLDHTRPLYRQFPDPWTQLRLHWLEGRIARALGRLGDAVPIFQRLQEALQARQAHHETVLVSLDLAEALVARGAFEAAVRVVREVHPVMAGWGLHRHLLAAWLLLQQSLEQRQLDALFNNLQLYFRRHWHQPAEFTRGIS